MTNVCFVLFFMKEMLRVDPADRLS